MSESADRPPARRRRPARQSHDAAAVRLTDVARLADVSTASVSRALNSPDSVSEALRARVEAAAASLGYAPNVAARSLRTRRSMSVGAVVPTIANSIFSPGVEAIASRLEAEGYALLLATSEYDPTRELRRVRTFLDRGVDAIILVGRYHHEDMGPLLASRGVPHVCQGAFEPEGPHPYVGFDNLMAMTQAIEHLLDLGHRRIAMLAGIRAGNDRVEDRIAAVEAALTRRGLALLDLIEAPYDVGEARNATARLFERGPTAVVCVNDVLALGVLFEARARGIEVPRHLSITGFDDFDFARHVEPPLTTVRVPVVEMGRGAAEYLLRLLAGETPPHATRLPTELIVRGSTAPPRP